MVDPSLPIQAAIFAALRAPGVLPAVVGDLVLDRPPASAALPYVVIGDALVVPDKATCVDGSETFAEIHCYSDAPGYREVKTIAAAIVSALDEADLPVAGHRVIACEVEERRFRRDASGLISIADITVRVSTEPV